MVQIIQGRPGCQTMNQILSQNNGFLYKDLDAGFDDIPLPLALPGLEYASSQFQISRQSSYQQNRTRF